MTRQISGKVFIGVLITLIMALSIAIWLQSLSRGQETTDKSLHTQKPETLSAFKEYSKPIYLPPVSIFFGKKTLQVEDVEVTDGGRLGVPVDWQKAGWYKNGAKAGEEGNVVIDGHYDTNTGAAAAFWELKDLQVGDKVTLTDQTGKNFEYVVDGKSYISINDPERSKVFESGKEKVLTLITCGGVWDYTSGTYNKRLVITAKFDKMEKSW